MGCGHSRGHLTYFGPARSSASVAFRARELTPAVAPEPRRKQGLSRTLSSLASHFKKGFASTKNESGQLVPGRPVPHSKWNWTSEHAIYQGVHGQVMKSVISEELGQHNPREVVEDFIVTECSNKVAEAIAHDEMSYLEEASGESLQKRDDEVDSSQLALAVVVGEENDTKETKGEDAEDKPETVNARSQRVKELVTLLESTFSTTSLAGRQLPEKSKTEASNETFKHEPDKAITAENDLVECPDQKCSQRIPLNDLQNHIKEAHIDARWLGDFQEPNVQYWNIRSGGNFEKPTVTWVLSLWKYDGFLFSSMFHKWNGHWYDWIYIFSNGDNAREYSCEISSGKTSTVLYEGPVVPITTTAEIVRRKKQCLVMSNEQVSCMLTTHGLPEARRAEGYDSRLPLRYSISNISKNATQANK